ncbi:MAG: alpha/beta hydrolase [Pseudomonadota bacterium]
MTDGLKTFTAADGLSLAYRDEGAGDPLLCLAGLTRNHRDFDEFAVLMRNRYRVIRLDSRGRGASDRDPTYANYNPLTEAGDALALLDHLGIERATIIGSSRGGMLAIMIAATAPHRLRGVVLNDVGPQLKPEGLAVIGSYLGVVPKAKTIDEAAAGMEAAFGADFPGAGRDFWRGWAERGLNVTSDGLELNYDPKLRDATMEQIAAADPDGPGLWPAFMALGPIPTLLLRGENSNLLGADGEAAMLEKKPDMLTQVVKDRGHIPRLDEPEAISAINAILERLL